MSSPVLDVIMYHYVLNMAKTKFPRLKGMALDEFRSQLDCLAQNYEMATLESATGFLEGTYKPKRDMCLLTFDDGLKEHYTEVTPLLAERKMQGLFFVITNCLEEATIATVHMNHLLMATLDWETYTREFLHAVDSEDSEKGLNRVNMEKATRTYPWDTLEVARFKYFFNFVLPAGVRDPATKALFRKHLGAEDKVSHELYMSWSEAREMQRAGMMIGGHSHRHRPLSKLRKMELRFDLERCRCLLDRHLDSQDMWPFSYPYGKADSFDERTVEELKLLSFDCGFSTEKGSNAPAENMFAIRRKDCKMAPPFQQGQVA
jgi:peptidoglycan/xylan/chitin deacetylase (PgdA/CDA1 family)